MLLDLRAVLATQSGKRAFKYLLKHLGVNELPEMGLTGELLMDKLGFLRAGNAVFRLLAEADVEVTSKLITKNEKERHAILYTESQNE